MTRLAAALLAGLTLAAITTSTRPAVAADRRAEAAAHGAIDKAANDYLSTDYAKAAARLQKALRVCGKSRCAAATRAAVLRDLGTMQFRNGDVGAAKKSWAEAVHLQPDIALNPNYDTPDLRAAWNESKAGGGGNGGEPEAVGPQPTGDFTHTPISEQRVNTPLPVYAEYPGTSTIARVVVKYRGASAADWSRVELKRMGSGWGGQIPCGDVARGTMRYWIQGFDDGGDPIASSGDPKHPYTVPIRDDIASEAPHLPGKPAPKTCDEDSDCPPGMAGCGADDKGSTEDDGAQDDEKPAAPVAAFARMWVGVSGELPEFLQLPGGNDLCKLTPQALPANSAGFYCTNPDGSDFPSRASADQNNHLSIQGKAGDIKGGVQAGDIRVMLSFDYALSASFLIGARVGYVFNAYTGQAASSNGKAFGPKVHLEARATYLFGHDPLAHPGFAPMVFLGLGASEFDGHSTSVVTLDNVAGQQPVNVWLTDGPLFATGGAGFRYQFSVRTAFTAAARANTVFGGNGFLLTYGPEVGVFYGF
ncbi:MAG: hypothetical protein ACRELB_26045 [Polyangiaceae bacterium]